jgi:hypothetical protein|tara:strand:- start:4452 stop:5021 length:570 start_codon:yes stop_codon:yes gene_type:complete
MLKSLIVAILIVSQATAFVPRTKPDVKTFLYKGDVKPLGYFDPLLLTTNLPDKNIKYVREAELQHGRAAMLAFLGLTCLDLVQDKLAINFLSSQDFNTQLPYWLSVGAFEFARMGSGWKNPFVEKEMYWKLTDDYQPGNVFKVDPKNITDDQYNKELSNGRLAMFSTLGYIAYEQVTGLPVFGHVLSNI